MLSNSDYVKQSLDINLFFLRILKEHAIFIKASLPSKNYNLINQAEMLKNKLEGLLNNTVNLSYGLVSISNDIVTKYTYEAERATSFLTGIPINSNITKAEISLGVHSSYPRMNLSTEEYIHNLNIRAIQLAKEIIHFKTFILENVLDCMLFTSNYPLLIEHIRREAKFYVDILVKLQSRTKVDVVKDAINQEIFWNQIMAEHAKFIRGYLDPSEETLFDIANNFGNEFDELTKEALKLTEQTSMLPKVTKESKEATKKIKDFKVKGTEGLINCSIKSIMVPLLGDHVLREANHYLLLLNKYGKEI